MGRFSEVRRDDSLPDRYFEAEINSLREDTWKDGRRIVKLVATITEPKEFAGAVYTQNFFLGTVDDPRTEDDETLNNSLGARKIVELAEVAGVRAEDIPDNIDELSPVVRGTRFIFFNKYNSPYNNMSDVRKVGSVDLNASKGTASTGNGATTGRGDATQPKETTRRSEFRVVERR